VDYANELSQTALERSSQDAYDVIRLARSKAAVWTVDDVARLIDFLKRILIYLFIFTFGTYSPKGREKLDRSQKTVENSSLLDLFIYYMNFNIQNVSSSRLYNRHTASCTVGCKV